MIPERNWVKAEPPWSPLAKNYAVPWVPWQKPLMSKEILSVLYRQRKNSFYRPGPWKIVPIYWPNMQGWRKRRHACAWQLRTVMAIRTSGRPMNTMPPGSIFLELRLTCRCRCSILTKGKYSNEKPNEPGPSWIDNKRKHSSYRT